MQVEAVSAQQSDCPTPGKGCSCGQRGSGGGENPENRRIKFEKNLKKKL
jgi:hypothetical protein